MWIQFASTITFGINLRNLFHEIINMGGFRCFYREYVGREISNLLNANLFKYTEILHIGGKNG